MVAAGGLFSGGIFFLAVERLNLGSECPSINSRFRELPEGQQPEDAEQLRIRWHRFHWARTSVALLLLACLAAATV